jgi:hypothetical protein
MEVAMLQELGPVRMQLVIVVAPSLLGSSVFAARLRLREEEKR